MEGVYLFTCNFHLKILLIVADALTSRVVDYMSILYVFPFDKPFFEQSVCYMTSFYAHCTYLHDAPAESSSGYEGR